MVQSGNAPGVMVHADHLMPPVGEARAVNQADIACPDHSDGSGLHYSSLPTVAGLAEGAANPRQRGLKRISRRPGAPWPAPAGK